MKVSGVFRMFSKSKGMFTCPIARWTCADCIVISSNIKSGVINTIVFLYLTTENFANFIQ